MSGTRADSRPAARSGDWRIAWDAHDAVDLSAPASFECVCCSFASWRPRRSSRTRHWAHKRHSVSPIRSSSFRILDGFLSSWARNASMRSKACPEGEKSGNSMPRKHIRH